MSELRHAKQNESDFGEIAFNLLEIAMRLDPCDPDDNRDACTLCDAAKILFGLGDVEESLRTLVRSIHD